MDPPDSYDHEPYHPDAQQEYSSPVRDYSELYPQSRTTQYHPQHISQHPPLHHPHPHHPHHPHPQHHQQQQQPQLQQPHMAPSHPPSHRHPPHGPHSPYITTTQHYPSSTDYAQMSGPQPNTYQQPSPHIPPPPAPYDHIPMSVEGYPYPPPINSAGPSTPATVNTQFSATTAGTSSSSHDSNASSSPVTPSSNHSSLSHIPAAIRTRSSVSNPGQMSQRQYVSPSHNGAQGQSQYANGGGLVHRQPLRSHSHSSTEGSVSGGSSRRRRRRSSAGGAADDSDDLDAELLGAVTDTLEQRREDARRQRQNAEQRRRDQLRDGYDRLQSVLPGAKEKMSKVRLIECATQYIQEMTTAQGEHHERIKRLESERDALRRQNEEVSHTLSGISPPVASSSGSTTVVPLASTSTAAPAAPSSMDTSGPSSSPKSPSTSSSSSRPPPLAPSGTLPGPLSGTGPPGQQRHTVNYSYTHSFNSASTTFPNNSSNSGEGGPPSHQQQTPQPTVRTEGLETLSLDEARQEAPPSAAGVQQQGLDGTPGVPDVTSNINGPVETAISPDSQTNADQQPK